MAKFTKGLIIACILLGGVLILAGGALSMSREMFSETFSVKPGTAVKVFNINGNIAVAAWDRDYVEVKAFMKGRLWAGFLEEPRIDVAAGDELVVTTHYGSAVSRAMIPVHYQITVPRGARVAQVETSTGKINVDGTSGDLDVKTSTGDIQIRRVEGSIHAAAGTGKARVEEVSGDVEAKTSTGDIRISKANGFVKAETGTGKVFVTEVGGLSGVRTKTGEISVEVPAIRGDLEIQSKMGDIAVSLAPGIAARLEAVTSSGQVNYANLPLAVEASSQTRLVGKLGAGDSRIRIAASMGSIRLRTLDGPSRAR